MVLTFKNVARLSSWNVSKVSIMELMFKCEANDMYVEKGNARNLAALNGIVRQMLPASFLPYVVLDGRKSCRRTEAQV